MHETGRGPLPGSIQRKKTPAWMGKACSMVQHPSTDSSNKCLVQKQWSHCPIWVVRWLMLIPKSSFTHVYTNPNSTREHDTSPSPGASASANRTQGIKRSCSKELSHSSPITLTKSLKKKKDLITFIFLGSFHKYNTSINFGIQFLQPFITIPSTTFLLRDVGQLHIPCAQGKHPEARDAARKPFM